MPVATAAYALADCLLAVADLFRSPALACERAADYDLLRFADIVHRAGGDPATADALVAALGAMAGADPAILEGDYNRLFDCGVTCPINEAGYIRRDKGAILGDIHGFQHAFGIQLLPGTNERGDHLVCELELCALLAVMAGNAAEQGKEEAAATTEKALRDFGDDHLGMWVLAFCERLAFTAGQDVYILAAEALRLSWSLVAMRFGIATASALEPAADPIPEADASSWDCPGGSGACA